MTHRASSWCLWSLLPAGLGLASISCALHQAGAARRSRFKDHQLPRRAAASRCWETDAVPRWAGQSAFFAASDGRRRRRAVGGATANRRPAPGGVKGTFCPGVLVRSNPLFSLTALGTEL